MSAARPTFAERLYRALLVAYPADFRRRFGTEAAQTFRELHRDERARGGVGAVVRLWPRTVLEVIVNGMTERWETRRGRRRDRRVALTAGSPGGRVRWVAGFTQDLRYAVRTLSKQPAYSLTVIGMLTLGIAGNAAIFSVFNGLFLRPLPFPNPEQLVDFDETAPQWGLEFVSVGYPDFHAYREENTTFQAIAVVDDRVMNLSSGGDARRVAVAAATHDMARVLQIDPLLGRHFEPEEDVRDGPKVAQLGYGLWQSQFGGDPEIVGTTVRLDSEPYTVIGVLPREATFLGDAELWVPLATDVDQHPGTYYLHGIGRLKPGVTVAQAREDLLRIHRNMIESRPANEITSPVVLPVLERLLGQYRVGTMAMLAAVGLVLLIACADIAGLMLARSMTRGREIAIRTALGAGRRRIVQQLLTESLVLSLVGATLGTALGYRGASVLVAQKPDLLPSWLSFQFDGRFLAFAIALTLGTTIVIGLVPALRISGTDPQATLQAVATRVSTSATRRSLSALVVGEIALALVLLILAGLTVRDLRRLERVDPGFTTNNVLTYQLSLPEATYPEDEHELAFYRDHLERVRALPGVTAAGAVNHAPLGGGHTGNFFTAEGAPQRGDHEMNPVVLTRIASAGYLEAIGVTLLAGRDISETDREGDDARVAIVNETFAHTFWGEENVVGLRIRSGGESNPWMTVIGVTRDVKHYGLDTEMRPGVYLPMQQAPRQDMTVVVRSAVAPTSLVGPIRELLRAADPELPMASVTTMAERLDQSLWARRAASWLAAVFSAIAMILAVSGIYGVISYGVTQRSREIGIRMALGARQQQVLRLVARQGMALVGIGVALGLAGAYTASRLMATLLVGVSASDPVVYGTVTALLIGVTVAANVLPARRAARVDPMEVLRGE